MVDPDVAEILRQHRARSGNALMDRAAERAQQLGYRLHPPGGSGQAGYLRLTLDGTPVTLYLHGNRLTAAGKRLRDFARSLPEARPTASDVSFPLGTVEIDVLQAFASHWGRAPAPATQPTVAPRPAMVVAAAIVLLFVVLGALATGIGGGLIMAGLGVMLVGGIAFLNGAARWAPIASRGVGAAVLAAGLAVLIAGGVVSAPPTEPTAQAQPAPTTQATPPSTSPPPSEADLEAADESAAALENDETHRTDVDSATGLLTDEATQEAIAGAGRTTALAALAAVSVKGRAPTTGYDRDLFGSGWVDTDRNGCDTRNDILQRDLTGETFKPGTRDCVVLTGTLADPYSGRTIPFLRGQGTSDDVQIDHVVALSDAWQKGAQGWTGDKRTTFANDPLNLLAVDGPLNQQKGDGDAATWLPPNRGYRCAYVARQVAVKATYGLWMTQAEKNAIATILTSCPDQPLPDGVVVQVPESAPSRAPAPAPQPAPAPAPQPAPAPVPPPVTVYYKNCAAARAAGAAPVHVGDPGYGRHLDRDGDGIGCE